MASIQGLGSLNIAGQYQTFVSEGKTEQNSKQLDSKPLDGFEFSPQSLQLAANFPVEDPIEDDPLPSDIPDPPD